MWDANSNDPNSGRPSAKSPVSPSFSDDASFVDLEDVDLRSATAQHTFRLTNLPTLIKSQTEAANKPPTLEVPGGYALPTPRSFAGRRPFNGVIVTTTRSTTRIGFNDPAPPYTPRASNHERTFGVDGYAVDQKEVSQINKWTYWIPSCKWLFWIGFSTLSSASLVSGCLTSPSVFPLFWALGCVTLFFGVHQSTASAIESGTSKLSKFINQAQIDETHRLESEKRWAKRCAWAFAFVCCLTPVIITIAMIAPYLDAPAAVQTAAAVE